MFKSLRCSFKEMKSSLTGMFIDVFFYSWAILSKRLSGFLKRAVGGSSFPFNGVWDVYLFLVFFLYILFYLIFSKFSPLLPESIIVCKNCFQFYLTLPQTRECATPITVRGFDNLCFANRSTHPRIRVFSNIYT